MTLPASLDAFREVWTADPGFSAPPGERLIPACLAARELRSGRTVRLGRDDLRRSGPPYPTDPGALFVAFEASGALGLHLALGWPMPCRVLDLHAEHRNRTNGLATPHGSGLYGALRWHGLDAMPGAHRPRLDALANRGGPYSESEQGILFAQCETRVSALSKLLLAMLPEIDLGRSLIRGRYMAAVARMERLGIPIDVASLDRLRLGWRGLQRALIRDVDSRFGVYDGFQFRADRWAAFLARQGIAWPRLASGALALDDDTFREMARSHPDVALMRELRASLGKFRLDALAVGSDGRNRTPLRPFASKTGRNQPSTSRFIFGPWCWLRGLIKPGPGRAVAHVDWCHQEFGIAAALSGDPAMLDAYGSGDPYLAFGRQAGGIPPGATKQSHGAERERFKACSLGALYGMGREALAGRIGRSPAEARALLAIHRVTYPKYWAWSDGAEHRAMGRGSLQTAFGWTIRPGADANPRSLRNFPCQANGAEMLRFACSLATERGLSVVAPIHDAVMIEGQARTIEADVVAMQEAMAEASETVLDGFRLRSEAKIVRWPERYMDERGREFWGRVMALLPTIAEASFPEPLSA